ncbi:MAG: AAA family ATPase [Actinomycetota bacterium]
MLRDGGRSRYFVLAGVVLLAAYSVTALILYSRKDFASAGPLSLYAPGFIEPLSSQSLPYPSEACFSDRERSGHRVKVVGGPVEGRHYFACYLLTTEASFAESADVLEVRVIDSQGDRVVDPQIIKRGGAWPWFALVKTGGELILAGLAVIALWVAAWVYRRMTEPGVPVQGAERGLIVAILLLVPVLGWIVLRRLGVSRRRMGVVGMRMFFVLLVLMLSGFLTEVSEKDDFWGATAVSFMFAALLLGLIASWFWVEPAPAPSGAVFITTPSIQPVSLGTQRPTIAPTVTPDIRFPLTKPGDLPSFDDVGGMDDLKAELKNTIGLILAFVEGAADYRITWNGLLLHGPPGVGKTFIARAAAGELGLNFIHISAGDLMSGFRGESARNVERVFRFAARHVPCILFFDEFDSVGQRRGDYPDQESRRTVGELLQTVEEYRAVAQLIVVAATNDLEGLDPAVVRPGRFDRHIRLDLPDEKARAAIFSEQLEGRPTAADIDYGVLASRSEGMSPAAIAQVVEMAALRAFRDAASSGRSVEITTDILRQAMRDRGGKDRPTIENWSWDRLILPNVVKAELQEVVMLIENPELAASLGVEPPTGILLSGPPGTGKTSIARVIAAQADCSFYPVSSSDVTSMWLGESEKSIARLFDRARANAPSIIFFDEIDAIGSSRGTYGAYDRQINELLQQIDGVAGQRGVLVIGATNRPDRLDAALTRGGRLSRSIEIPLPDREARLALFRLMTKKMPISGVDLESIADATEGLAGADIEAVCQQAALEALIRTNRGRKTGGDLPRKARIDQQDFDRALNVFSTKKQNLGQTARRT